MSSFLKVYDLGTLGLNIDASPLDIKDQELTLSQNVMADILAGGGLHKRPGLGAANENLAPGPVLGGIGVPLVNLSASVGHIAIYLGRGPV